MLQLLGQVAIKLNTLLSPEYTRKIVNVFRALTMFNCYLAEPKRGVIAIPVTDSAMIYSLPVAESVKT